MSKHVLPKRQRRTYRIDDGATFAEIADRVRRTARGKKGVVLKGNVKHLFTGRVESAELHGMRPMGTEFLEGIARDARARGQNVRVRIDPILSPILWVVDREHRLERGQLLRFITSHYPCGMVAWVTKASDERGQFQTSWVHGAPAPKQGDPYFAEKIPSVYGDPVVHPGHTECIELEINAKKP